MPARQQAFYVVSHAKNSLMKFSCVLILIPLLICLTHCQSGSDHILEKFKEVDKSIQTSTTPDDHSINHLYLTISKKRSKNGALVIKADSVFATTNSTLKFIDSLKEVMKTKDTSETDLDLSTKLLVGTKTGDELQKALIRVSDITSHSVVNDSNKVHLDDILESINEIKTDKEWTKKYFKMTPTIASMTILSKFQNDCTNAAITAFKDIKQHLID